MRRVSSKRKNNFGSNPNKPKQDLFQLCFGLFREPKIKKFGLFRCFEPISKQPKQTELFRGKPKQTKTTLNFLKNTKICSLSNCFGWSSVCFGSIETSKLSVSVKKRNNWNKLFRNKPKQTETTLNFFWKNTKICSLSNCFGWASFFFVQSKHRNSLFRYRIEITETNVLSLCRGC